MNTTQEKAYIFTVVNIENDKPTVWAQYAGQSHVDNQEKAEQLIRDWFNTQYKFSHKPTDVYISELARDMRETGIGCLAESDYWYNLNFELTGING